MGGNIGGATMNWFTPNEDKSQVITANTDVSMSEISAVFFTDSNGDAVDVAITIGGFATPFPLPAGTALGIDETTEVIQTDINCVMFAMGR